MNSMIALTSLTRLLVSRSRYGDSSSPLFSISDLSSAKNNEQN